RPAREAPADAREPSRRLPRVRPGPPQARLDRLRSPGDEDRAQRARQGGGDPSRRAARDASADRGVHDRGERRGREANSQVAPPFALSRARGPGRGTARGADAVSAKLRLQGAACREAHAEASRRRDRQGRRQARGRARRDGRAALVEAGALSAPQHRALRARACRIYALHVADQALSRSARASRDQVVDREGFAERLPLLAARNGAARRALLALRAAGGRSRLGCGRAVEVPLHEHADRRGDSRDRELRGAVRALRARARAQGRRSRPRHVPAAGLLPPGSDRHEARRRAHRPNLPADRYARRPARRRQRRGAEDRFRAGRAAVTARRIYGVHAVRAVLARRPDAVVRALVLDEAAGGRLADLVAELGSRGIEIERTDRHELDRLTGGAAHQGIVVESAAEAEFTLTDFEELVVSRGSDARLLVLDGVEDPRNLGACLRTADAAGIDAVVVPRS